MTECKASIPSALADHSLTQVVSSYCAWECVISVILYVFCSPYIEVISFLLLSPGLAKHFHLDRWPGCAYFLLCNRPAVSADPSSYAHFHTSKHFTMTLSLSLSLSLFIFAWFAWSSLADESIFSSRCVNIFVSYRSRAVKTAVLLTLPGPLIFMDIFLNTYTELSKNSSFLCLSVGLFAQKWEWSFY